MGKSTQAVLIVIAVLIGVAALPALYMTGCMGAMMSRGGWMTSGHMMDGGSSQRPNDRWRD